MPRNEIKSLISAVTLILGLWSLPVYQSVQRQTRQSWLYLIEFSTYLVYTDTINLEKQLYSNIFLIKHKQLYI